MYIGYGLKTGDVCFNPTVPQIIMSDPGESKEMPEPTPLHAPPPAPGQVNLADADLNDGDHTDG